MKYRDIFWSFFKVGTFTVGGGYAMLPLMQREIVDKHRWLTEEEFLDQVALSQALPGVFAVNMAALTGQRLRGAVGSAVAIVGNILMPILFILLLAMFFRSFRDNVYVERIFLGLRPAVVALIAAPVFTLFKNEKLKVKNETDSVSHFSLFISHFSLLQPLRSPQPWRWPPICTQAGTSAIRWSLVPATGSATPSTGKRPGRARRPHRPSSTS